MDSLARFDPDVVRLLVGVLSQNPYAIFLKKVSDLEDIDDYHIVIRTSPGLDQTGYNKPTCYEVATIWLENEGDDENESAKWDIRVYGRSGGSHNVCNYFGCYDPLQYVLMFPNGESGWNGGIAKIERDGDRRKVCRRGVERNLNGLMPFQQIIEQEHHGLACVHNNKRSNVSCREYYAYKLQIGPNDRSFLLRFRHLLQQYIVDNYVKIESMRFDFLKKNQKKFRRKHYQGLIDGIVSGIEQVDRVRTRTYLPASFIGRPRDMRQRYLGSMALVQEFGKPDVSLTMTCNPNWLEIKELLETGEEYHNRPDLAARVFKAKLSIMNDMITSGEIFGEPAYVVYAVEFQKRGLPHTHFLIILKPAFRYHTTEAYDCVVSAKIPDPVAGPSCMV